MLPSRSWPDANRIRHVNWEYRHTASELLLFVVNIKWTWCLTSTETIRLIRDGGKGVWRWGKREIIIIPNWLHCHHQNDSCTKMGSDESWLNVSLIREGRSHKTVSTDHNFWRERSTEGDSNRGPSAVQPNTLPLGQTGSLWEGPHIEWARVHRQSHTPSTAFRHLPPRKDVVNRCLEFEVMCVLGWTRDRT